MSLAQVQGQLATDGVDRRGLGLQRSGDDLMSKQDQRPPQDRR